jgi:hypothetical protein
MRKLLSVLSSTLQGGVRGGLLFVALLATTSLWAQYFKYGDLYYRIESEGEPYTASVTWPWDGRHYYDYGLDTISILDSVKYGERTYLVNTIESSAFKECGDLVSITIPNTITEIGNYAFEGCYNLRTIVIPNSVKSIGIKVFFGSYNLASITMPNSITSLGKGAFYGLRSYSSYTLTASSIEEYLPGKCNYLLWYDCYTNLDEGSPDCPREININGKNVTEIIIPEGIECINSAIFHRCSSLSSVTIPCSVLWIGDNSFSYCTSLNSITLPEKLASIGCSAFANCTNLDTIYSFADIPPTICSNTFEKTSIKEVFVHAHALKEYEDQWGNKIEDTTVKFSPLKGEAVFAPKIEVTDITQTKAKIKAIVTNTDSTYSYNAGYILKEDTIYVDYSDTLEFTVTNLSPNQSNEVTLFVGKADEPIDNYVLETTNIKTESINLSVQIGTRTQTTAKITLSVNAGDATAIEQGILFIYPTYPNKHTDTIPFELNQTDTILTGLAPGTSYSIVGYCKIIEDNKIYTSESYTCTTKDVEVVISDASQTQTTLNVGIRYNSGDATVIDKGLVVHFPNGNIDTMSIWNSRINNDYRGGMLADTLFTNLRVNTEYDMYGFVRTAEGGLKVGNGSALYTKKIEGTIISPARTQTTLSLSATLDLGDAIDYGLNGLEVVGGSTNTIISFEEGVFTLDTTFTNLSPSTKYSFRLLYIGKDCDGKEYISYGDTKTFSTNPVYLSEPTLQATGQTFIEVQTSNVYGDANLIEEVVEVTTNKNNTPEHRVHVAGRSNVIINNLMPDTKYYFRNVLSTQETGTMYSEWYESTTEPITLATGEADGISNSSAFLHGTIDCDTMSRTEIGFEWKRSDAPSTVKPQRLLVVDRVDENLIFRLEGLSSDRYYDFRTFCLYNGKEYYGEWVGFLTSDKDILIPPSVQTREAEITDLGVLMKGFVVAGTEVILQRGFECWREESDQVATTVAEGAIMSSYIPEAWSYTTYKYRAYAKTPAGTTYGETLEVTTEYIATNIADIIVNASSNSAQVTWTIVEQADYYILTLYSDESMTEVIGVYTVDKNGNVTQKRVASATQSLVTCELTELLPETNYYFAVKAYNNNDQMVAEENGSFATTVVPTAVENAHSQSPVTNSKKILRDNQLLILHDDKTYNIVGQIVE